MIVYFDLFLGILAANQEISVSFFLIFSSSYFICYLVSLQSMFFLSFNLLCFSVKLLLKKVTVYDFRVFWVCFFMIWLQGYIQNIRIPHICWYNTNETLLVSCNPLHWWCAIFAGVACSGSCISCLLEQPFLASISCDILAFPSLFLMSVWLVIIPLVGFSVTMPFDGGHLQECHGSFYLFKRSLSDSAKL